MDLLKHISETVKLAAFLKEQALAVARNVQNPWEDRWAAFLAYAELGGEESGYYVSELNDAIGFNVLSEFELERYRSVDLLDLISEDIADRLDLAPEYPTTNSEEDWAAWNTERFNRIEMHPTIRAAREALIRTGYTSMRVDW